MSWTVTNGLGGDLTIAEQPMIIQLTDNNTASSSTTFSIVSAPATLTLDSVTGEALWTPSVADIGPHTIALQATNPVGPRDVIVRVNVLFSGPVQNLSGTRVFGTQGTSVTWDPPTDNVLPVANYQVRRAWTFAGSHRTSSTSTIPGTSTSASVGGKANLGITITPVDEFGHVGVSSRVPVTVVPAPPPPAPVNVAPEANAGPDKAITLPHTAVTLNGSTSDDGLPNPPGALSPGQGQWPLEHRTQQVPLRPSPLMESTHLRLAVSDSVLSHQDDVIVTVSPQPPAVNVSPIANAGWDLEIRLPDNVVTLNGSATDDGLPNSPGTLTYTWSTVSGPGTVTFGNANAASTTASFSADGTYTLRLTASDGQLSSNNDLVVTVSPEPSTPSNGTPPAYDPNAEQIELEDSSVGTVGPASLSFPASRYGIRMPP